MKTTSIIIASCFLFFISFAGMNKTLAQSGIECSWCHGMNGHHNAGCRYLGSSTQKTTSAPQSVSLEQEIMTQIFTGMIKNMFNNSTTTNTNTEQSDQEKQQQLQEEKLRQQRLDNLLKRQKRINDSLAQVRHDKMMKEYKPLDSSGKLAYKGLDDGNQFKKINFSCKMTEFKGQVVVVRSDGKKMMVTENSIVDLAPGDWIATGPASRVKLHYAFEKGGKDVILGQNSGLTIVTEDDGQQTPKQVAGYLYAISDPVSEMAVVTQEEMQYKIDQVIGFGVKRFNMLKSCNKVRTPAACSCTRGTEFTSSIDSVGNTTIHVIEGMVDLYGDTDDRVVTLTPGYFGVVNTEGKIVQYEKFDVAKFTRWWAE